MGLAERHPLADQQVGDVGRGHHLVGRRLGQPLAVEAQPGEHPLGRLEAELDRVDGVEQRLLVLLEVLGVGERQRVQHAERGSSARPATRGDFARSSSAASGFFFCGIRLEPEAKSSAGSQKPNSWLDQITISAPRRERWVAQTVAAYR